MAFVPPAKDRPDGGGQGEGSGEGKRRFAQRHAGRYGLPGHALTFVSLWSFLFRSRISGLLTTPSSVSSSTRRLA